MIDPRSGQLVTLTQASELMGKPPSYFRIRRYAVRSNDEHPFPQPVIHVAGALVYDFQTLVVWDEQRLQRDAAKRNGWAEKRAEKEKKR